MTVSPVISPAERGFVKSLDRGLTVIKSLSGPGPGRTAADVARQTGLTRASARRFLLTLEHLGYVRSDDRRFALTPRALELGYAYLSSLSLPQIAQPHLRELVDLVHESSSVSVLDGAEVVYVAREATVRIMTVAIAVGTRFPAHATSMGRVLLSGLAVPDLDRFLAGHELQPLTPATVTDPDKLRAAIEQVRAQGWALVDQELEIGLRAVAVPIHNPSGQVVAAMNLSTHASHRSADSIHQDLLPPLRRAAEMIERDLAAGGGG
jgi:IclR family transcriptional regulator, pca regulon regulatory protein